MPIEKCEAIIVRRVYFGNSTLILSLFSKEFGMLECIAKGCRRPKNRLYGKLDYFCSGELVFYRKSQGALHIVSEFSPTKEAPYYQMPAINYTAAYLLSEIVGIACAIESPCTETYTIFTSALETLRSSGDVENALLRYLLSLLGSLGFAPALNGCASCGMSTANGQEWFSAEKGGIICSDCRHERGAIQPAPDTLSALRFLSRSPDAVGRLSLRSRTAREALQLVASLAEAQFGRKLRSHRFFVHLIDKRRLKNVA